MRMTITKINDHNSDEDDDIILEEIEDKQPPEHMERTATLQEWRCTKERRHVQLTNTDCALSDCHELWRAWFASEEAKKTSANSTDMDSHEEDPS